MATTRTPKYPRKSTPATSAQELVGQIQANITRNLHGLPAPTPTPNVFAWVARAVATPGHINATYRNSTFLRVHVVRRQMVASDGHRMHIAPTKLKAGQYDCEGTITGAPVGPFPEGWEKLVPDDRTSVSITGYYRNDKDGPKEVVRFSNGIKVDARYFNQAWTDDPVADCRLFCQGLCKPLLILYADGRVAVIMPLVD